MGGSRGLYTTAGSLVDRKTIIASLLLLILLVPIASAYAENFTVTTNKDIYAIDEKVIVVGVIPSDSPEGYAILIRVTGPNGRDCATQNILPAQDSSFVSRPIKIDGCGLGEYAVSAFYADLESTSTFAVSNSTQTDAGSRLELRMIKNVVLQAQEAVNARVQELIDANYVLPEDIADKYSKGISETSLTLQAVDFGDAAEAKKHVIFAIRDFREVLDAFSSGRFALFEQTAEQQAAANDRFADNLAETYSRLQEFYGRLVGLADKNHVDKQREFATVSSLLASSRQMIDNGNLEGAEQRLAQVNSMLERIRTDLFESEGVQDEKATAYSTNNSTEPSDEAQRLANVADKFEKSALKLLNETGPDSEAVAKVNEALSLITNARSSIGLQDYDSARESLSAAYKALNEARSLIEDSQHEDNSNGNSRSSDSDHKDNSGEGSGDSGSTKSNEGHQ
jgi:hypothetical protein